MPAGNCHSAVTSRNTTAATSLAVMLRPAPRAAPFPANGGELLLKLSSRFADATVELKARVNSGGRGQNRDQAIYLFPDYPDKYVALAKMAIH